VDLFVQNRLPHQKRIELAASQHTFADQEVAEAARVFVPGRFGWRWLKRRRWGGIFGHGLFLAVLVREEQAAQQVPQGIAEEGHPDHQRDDNVDMLDITSPLGGVDDVAKAIVDANDLG